MQRFPGCDGVGGSELARCSSPRWSGYETDPLLVTRAPLFLLPWGCESMMSTTTQPRQGAAPGEPAAGGGGLHGRSPWRPRSLCAGHGVCTCVPVCPGENQALLPGAAWKPGNSRWRKGTCATCLSPGPHGLTRAPGESGVHPGLKLPAWPPGTGLQPLCCPSRQLPCSSDLALTRAAHSPQLSGQPVPWSWGNPLDAPVGPLAGQEGNVERS